MRLSKVWTIASKDLSIFRRRKTVVASTLLFSLLVSVGLPQVLRYAASRSPTGQIPTTALIPLLNAFTFFYVIGAAILPTNIAAYSLVGEKVEKSLEPLLATPTTDGEILLGKSIAAFLPPMAAIYAGSIIFMTLMDRFTYDTLHYLYFPNWNAGIVFLLIAPFASILCIEFAVILSARLNEVRSVQQTGALIVLPFAALYVATEVNIITLDTTTLLSIAGAMAAIDLALFLIARATFRREEILTRWK